MTFYVYALYNRENQKIYIGQTKNLLNRVNEHNNKRGRHYTALYSGNWIVVYQEKITTRTDALQRERRLKSYKGRQFIKNLIAHSPVAQW